MESYRQPLWAFIIILFFSPFVKAEVLPSGALRFHQSVGIVSYGSLFAGDEVVVIGSSAPTPSTQSGGTLATDSSSSSSSGGVSAVVLNTSASLGLFAGFQLDANAAYRYSSISGSQGNRQDGEFEAGISEIGIRVMKNVIEPKWGESMPFGMNVYLGLRAPGNAPAPADDFLALNDGSLKYDLGLKNSLFFEGFGLESDLAFTLRSNNEQAPQFRFSLSVPVTAVKGVTFGPFATFFTTFGGIDIGDSEFTSLAQSQGAPPFSRVKEDYFSAGAFVAVPVSEMVAIDGSFQKKLMGRNTDNSVAFNLGVGLNF